MKLRTLFGVALLALFSLLLATEASAQTSASIKKGEAYTLIADYDAPADPEQVIAAFRIYANGKLLTTKTASEAGCNSFPCSPQFAYNGTELGRGTYNMFMEAVDDQGLVSAPSNSVTLTVTTGPPHAPKNLRVVKQNGGDDE